MSGRSYVRMLIRPVRGQPQPLHFISHQLSREVHTAAPTGRGAQLRLRPHGLGLGEQSKAGSQVNPKGAQPGISSHPITGPCPGAWPMPNAGAESTGGRFSLGSP